MLRRTAFVTGGTGFVGSHVVEELLRRGYKVRCLVRQDPKWIRDLDVEVVRGSLSDAAALRDGASDVDMVFHVAALTRSRNPAELDASNVSGTIRLLEAVAEQNPGIGKIVVTSSLAVVGATDDEVATEQTRSRPLSHYGRSKATMEAELSGAVGGTNWMKRLPIVVVRPSAVYGPRETDIFTFFKSVSSGLCPIIGSGRQPEISLVYATDLAFGIVDAAESERTLGKTYFIGSEEFYSWNQIRDAAIGAVDRRVVTIRVPRAAVPAVAAASEWWGRVSRDYPALNREKAAEILNACKMCSVELAMQDFGYRQRTSLADGVRATVDWYRRQGWMK